MQKYIEMSGFEALIGDTVRFGWWIKGQCPAHDDQDMDLIFREFSWGIGVRCSSGCVTAAICNALGIDPNSLFKSGSNPFVSFDPVLSVGEFVAQKAPEHEFLVENLLPAGGTSIFAAKPKVGKSILAIHLADCVAQGIPFLGRKTNKAAVLHLTFEGTQSQTQQRVAHTVRDGSAIDCFFGTPHETRARDWLEYRLSMRDYGLVIVDPMSKLVNVSDYDNYAQMNRAIKFFSDLALEFGPHITILHHEGKRIREDGDGVLGSTAIFGGVDTLIVMRKQNHQRLIYSVNRYGTDIPKSILEYDAETCAVGIVGTVGESSLARAKEKVLLLLADGAERPESEIKSSVDGHSNGEVSKAIRVLVDDGKLRRTGSGKRNDPFMYRLGSGDGAQSPSILDLLDP